MSDADNMVIPGTVYRLASALDSAMALDASARATYARIYGREWTPVLAVAVRGTVSASTTAMTVR